MNETKQLQNNVERWLVHENYRFNIVNNEENNFCFVIKDSGAYKNPIEIFEPKKQLGVLVLGGKIFMKNNQTARYLKLNDSEREKFQKSLKEYCDSIRAIHKIFQEDGKVVVGIYVVLDKVEKFTQEIVLNAIEQVNEMSEKTLRFIMKTF